MKEVTIDQIERDARITNSDIPLVNKVSSEEEVIALIDKTNPGDYISVINRNNLAEAFIYKRNDVTRTEKFCKWDGYHRDITWYNENDIEFHLYTPAQLAGLDYLVTNGNTFKDKYIYLECDVDLNYHSWHSIGANDLQFQNNKFHARGTFNGTFDGLNHTIFGLRNNTIPPQYTFAFFMSLVGATVQNIIFDHCMIESINTDMICSVVAVSAISTTFSNIVVRGKIIGTNISGICSYATNTVFYSCKNDTEMISNSRLTPRIICGGICGELEITKDIMEEMDIDSAKVFSNCVDCGTLVIKGTNINTIYAGHLFGNFLCEEKKFSTIIEKCTISEKSKIEYRGNCDNIETVFYGSVEGDPTEGNRISKTSKRDLLSGTIGRASIDCDITVIKVTNSVIVRNMVLPGTINTLQSKSGESSFYTVSAESTRTEDCIYNLEPYFSFIKSVRY